MAQAENSEEKWKKAGLCSQCGLVKTHKILLGGRVRLAQTDPGKTYKGYCLKCKSMAEIQIELNDSTDAKFNQGRKAYGGGDSGMNVENTAFDPMRGDLILDDDTVVSEVTLDPSIVTHPALSSTRDGNTENRWSMGNIVEEPSSTGVNSNCQTQGLSSEHVGRVKLSYRITGSGGFRWVRVIYGADFKFGWERLRGTDAPSVNAGIGMDLAYARKVEFWEGNDNGVRIGRVSLVDVEESMVECANDHGIVSLIDVEKAHKMDQRDKTKWFQEACYEVYSVFKNEEPTRIKVRHKHMLDDSLEAVMSLSQFDLRKKWAFEREIEIGELTSQEWYKSVVEQLFCSDAGLWQKCAMDETRMEINFISELVCPNHLKYFRFVGRILGKAFVDRQPVRCRLAKHIYKLLLGWPIVLDDLKDVNAGTHNYLRSLEEAGEDVANLGLHFTVSEDLLGLRTRVPLVPNGFEVTVVEENLPEYIDSCFKYYVLGRCETQLNSFLLGFFDIVPEPLLAVFDFQELEALMCGSYTGGKTEEGELDVEVRNRHLEQPQAFEEEIVHNIFNEPRHLEVYNIFNEPVLKRRQLHVAPKLLSHLRTGTHAPLWAEEKVEEQAPETLSYPISNIPDLTATKNDITQSHIRECKPLDAHVELCGQGFAKNPQETWFVPGIGSQLHRPHETDDISALTHATHFNDNGTTGGIQSIPQQNNSNLPANSGTSLDQQGDGALQKSNFPEKSKTDSVGAVYAGPRHGEQNQEQSGARQPSSHQQNPNLPAISEGNSGLQLNALPPTANPDSSSSPRSSVVEILEAQLVSDDDPPLYDAVQVDINSTLGPKERSLLIKKGCCPTCGLQTKRVSGLFKKKYEPLTNEHVLSGRCLLCNPIQPQPSSSRAKSNASNLNDGSSSGSESNELSGVQGTIDSTEVSPAETTRLKRKMDAAEANALQSNASSSGSESEEGNLPGPYEGRLKRNAAEASALKSNASLSGSESEEENLPGPYERRLKRSAAEANALKSNASSSGSESEEGNFPDPYEGRLKRKMDEGRIEGNGEAVETADLREIIDSNQIYEERLKRKMDGGRTEGREHIDVMNKPESLRSDQNNSKSSIGTHKDSDQNSSKLSIEPAGANIATIATTKSNSKAVRCRYCFTQLYMPEAGTSFLCERCSKVSHLDYVISASSLKNLLGAEEQQVGSLKSNTNDRFRCVQSEESRDKGDAAFMEADTSEAVRWYNRAIELNSEDHQSLSNLSATYLRMGDASSTLKALTCSRQISKIRVNCPRGYYNKGSALCLLQRFEDAMLVFESALAKFPGDVALTIGLRDAIESISSSIGGTHNIALQHDQIFPSQVTLKAETINELEGENSIELKQSGTEVHATTPAEPRRNDGTHIAPQHEQIFPTQVTLDAETVSDFEVENSAELKQSGTTTPVTTPALLRRNESSLSGEATYCIPAKHPFRLIIARGPVTSFLYPSNPERSAIVNSANEPGVSDAICRAGGPNLMDDRRSLPVASSSEGSAFVTSCNDCSNSYGSLNVPFVIHAVGPQYSTATGNNLSRCDYLLSSAYMASLNCGMKNHIEAIAFSLLSVGHNRGDRPLNEVLRICMESICTFDGYPGLKEVYIFASTRTKAEALMTIAVQIGLTQELHQSDSVSTSYKSSHNDEEVLKAEQSVDQLSSDLLEHATLTIANDHIINETDVPLVSSSTELLDQPKDSAAGKVGDHLLCDSEAIDENLDMLGRLVNLAAAHRNMHFDPSTYQGNVVPRDLQLNSTAHPTSAVSGLTLESYFRRDDGSVAASALLSKSLPDSDELKEFDTIRLRLNALMECMDSEPVQLTPRYVDMIKTEKMIGRGCFGEVRLGIDEPMGKQFAIKLIRSLVIEQALASRLESIQKSFQNEIEILTQLRHPNIAPLYGYCMEGTGLRNTCLLYELAINGSLDTFWIHENNLNELQRQRLSDTKIRAKIALQVATVLRYMHEGLDGGAKCFHRDIKSANICLMADFSARVIDCGLAKYVTEEEGSFSTGGPTGTPGYTCPQYLQGQIRFQSACDVFSFGVLVCELITGRISCRRAQHAGRYKGRPQRLKDDADPCVDWGSGLCLDKLATLATKCIKSSSKKRPSIARVVKQLQDIVNDHSGSHEQDSAIVGDLAVNRSLSHQSSEDVDESFHHEVDISQRKCRICGEVSTKCIRCSGGDKQHVHCHNCLESHLQRNLNLFRYGALSCLKDGCNSRRFRDEEVSSLVSQDIWDSYSNQRNSCSLFQLMGKNLVDKVEANFRQMQDLVIQLSAGNGLPCPKLFILVEADSQGRPLFWRNPKEWAKHAGSVKLYLYFVCSHSLKPVSANCRIKVRYRRDWLKAISPALNVSIELIKMSVLVALGREVPLDFAKIKEMDEWAKELLEPADRDAIEEASNSGCKNMNPDLHTLVGDSLSRVAEKAASSNVNWQSELVPVYDYEKNEPTFVMEEYVSDSRYQRETDIFYSP